MSAAKPAPVSLPLIQLVPALIEFDEAIDYLVASRRDHLSREDRQACRDRAVDRHAEILRLLTTEVDDALVRNITGTNPGQWALGLIMEVDELLGLTAGFVEPDFDPLPGKWEKIWETQALVQDRGRCIVRILQLDCGQVETRPAAATARISYTQPELDRAIEKFFGDRWEAYSKCLNGRTEADAKKVFGVAAIAKELKPRSKSMISQSEVYKEKSKALDIYRGRKSGGKKPMAGKKVGADIAIEQASLDAGDQTAIDVENREAIQLVKKSKIDKQAKDDIIDRLNRGSITAAAALSIVKEAESQSMDNRSRRA